MNTLGKICFGILGVAMIGVGVAALAAPGETFMAMSWLWSVLMLVGGIASVVGFAKCKGMPGRGLLLLIGIVSILLALMLLGNGTVFTSVVVLSLLRIWIICAGVTGIVGSFTLKDAGAKNWWLDLIIGIALVVLGLSASASAVANVALTALVVGLGLILGGIGCIVKIFQKQPEQSQLPPQV